MVVQNIGGEHGRFSCSGVVGLTHADWWVLQNLAEAIELTEVGRMMVQTMFV